MKMAKRLVCLLLTLAMLLSLAIGVVATPAGDDTSTIGMDGALTGGKITINDAIENEVYYLYQILYIYIAAQLIR